MKAVSCQDILVAACETLNKWVDLTRLWTADDVQTLAAIGYSTVVTGRWGKRPVGFDLHIVIMLRQQKKQLFNLCSFVIILCLGFVGIEMM